jgi:hypothetical protein
MVQKIISLLFGGRQSFFPAFASATNREKESRGEERWSEREEEWANE